MTLPASLRCGIRIGIGHVRTVTRATITIQNPKHRWNHSSSSSSPFAHVSHALFSTSVIPPPAPSHHDEDDSKTKVKAKESKPIPATPLTTNDTHMVNDMVSRMTSNEEVVDLLLSRLPNHTRLNMVNAIMDSAHPAQSAYTPSALSGRHRRAIAVSALSEVTGRDHSEEVKNADTNSDGVVDRAELRSWLKSVGGGPSSEAHATVPSKLQYWQLAMLNGIPFIGFGFLDNSIMLLAGDAIDNSLGVALGITTLASAGLGNLCSDVIGLGATGWIESLALRMGLPDPKLTREQLSQFMVRLVRFIAMALGISLGCLLGMFPLLFMDPEVKELKEVFASLDVDKSGKLSKSELKLMIETATVLIGEGAAKDLLHRAEVAVEGNQMDFKDFSKLIHDLKVATQLGGGSDQEPPKSARLAKYLHGVLYEDN